jgi:16S rRNA C967 or C1407 C5-methylase (RsmB/RsmF family)
VEEENRLVVEGFLKSHPEFEPEDFTIPARVEGYADILSCGGMVTLTPDRHGTDGFFVARMKRIN